MTRPMSASVRTVGVICARNDARVTVEVGEALEPALKDAARPVHVKVYPSALAKIRNSGRRSLVAQASTPSQICSQRSGTR